ncbi:MAG TPA: helix-turn-helix domain-containing protein [Streptosporangiaceae bacterium]|nr:helix-turn-helix domain-containing protein [Streptosporangiaceae bacterium]
MTQRRQFAYWREMICEAFLDLTPESGLRDGFFGRVTQQSLEQLDLARIESQAQLVRRTEADITRSPQSGFYANFQLRGTGVTIQDGRVAVTKPGDLTLIDTTRPFSFEFGDDFSQLSLHIPDELLRSQLEEQTQTATATRISTVTGVGAAIRHALTAIDSGELAPGSAAKLARHTIGLLAVALDQPEPTGPVAARHDRLLIQALDDIHEHLTDADLSPARTAARLGISVRLLHQLFAGHEHSYAATVRQCRLDQARRDLADPARAGLRIIDIAADNGFADVTHFHRVFRQVYGYTPAELRRGRPGS